jgi:hypothetical protein
MSLGLYEVGRAGRQCVVAAPTMVHARDDAALHLGGRPTAVRRIGVAAEDIARGVVVVAPPESAADLSVGPLVIAAALRAAGFAPTDTRSRTAFVGRAAAWTVLRLMGDFSFPQIGALTGHHHSTVMYALEHAGELAANVRYQAGLAAGEAAYRKATGT